jgi:hypothetical protein
MLGLLVAGTVGAGASLQAQTVNFQGKVTGCFFQTPTTTACTTNYSAPTFLDNSISGLVYSPNAVGFNGTTNSSGFLGIGGNDPQNFGDMKLGTDLYDYTGGNFDLFITFSSPTVANGQLFTAIVEGAVTAGPAGGVSIIFTPDEITNIPFSNGQPGGTVGKFDLSVNNISLLPGGNTVALSGDIQVLSSTPEPATLGLMAMGLVGLVPVIRRRRKA